MKVKVLNYPKFDKRYAMEAYKFVNEEHKDNLESNSLTLKQKSSILTSLYSIKQVFNRLLKNYNNKQEKPKISQLIDDNETIYGSPKEIVIDECKLSASDEKYRPIISINYCLGLLFKYENISKQSKKVNLDEKEWLKSMSKAVKHLEVCRFEYIYIYIFSLK
jgi:hypothetical protein